MRAAVSASLTCALMLWSCPASATRICNTCTPQGSCETTCYETGTYPVWAYSFAAAPFTLYEVQTSDLKNIPGQSNVVDTVMWLLNTDAGTVLTIDDDGGSGYGSYLSYQTYRGGFNMRIVVAGYAADRQGLCDIELKANGGVQATWNDQMFGGWSKSYHQVHPGDRVFVGVPPDGADHTLYANRLYVFSHSPLDCDEECGEYVEGASLSSLSQALVDFSASARFQVGSGLPDTAVSTRLFHARLGSSWGADPAFDDNDGDGLTWQIEALADGQDPSLTVNTCDTAAGPSGDCSTTFGRKFAAREGFDPRDTDNDGLQDHWEVFGVRRGWSAIPSEPYFDPGADAGDLTWGTCSAVYCVSNGLSALDTAPREFNALLHVDSYGEAGHDHFLNPNQREFVRQIYEEEGQQCWSNVSSNPNDCPGELEDYNRIVLRVAQGGTYQEDQNNRTGAWGSRASFNRRMPWYRKHTGTHRYALMLHRSGGGQTDGAPARRFIVGESSDTVQATNFAHEHGHELGLYHGGYQGSGGPGNCESRNNKVNYPSLMNYAFDHKMPRKNQLPGGPAWPTDVGHSCTVPTQETDCPESKYCAIPDLVCRILVSINEVRFSRGLLPDQVEAVLAEDPIGQLLAVTQYAYDANGDGLPANPYSACCDTNYFDCPTTSTCGIDWDSDGNREDSPVCRNLNWFDDNPKCDPPGDHDPDCGQPDPEGDTFKDNDDWRRMYDKAKNALEDMYETAFRTYGCNFDDDGSGVAIDATDYSGCDQAVTQQGVPPVPSVDSQYQEAGAFGGPGAGDQVVLSDSLCLETMGMEAGGHGSHGWRADIYFRADDFQTGPGHQLFDSDLFQIDIVNSAGTNTGTLRAWFNRGGSAGWAILSSSRVLQPQTWYWVAAGYNGDEDPDKWDEGKLWVYVIEWDQAAAEWNTGGGDCDGSCVVKAGDVDPGPIIIGYYPGGSWAMKGLLDEPMLFNYWDTVRDLDNEPACPVLMCP